MKSLMTKTGKFRNVTEAIVIPFDQYVDDVHAALDDPDAIVNLDGSVDGNLPLEAMAKFYGVSEVTSIHNDGTEYAAIWIGFKQ